MSYDNTEDMESGGRMEKSDLMGRFDFDGAEGIAFWIGDSDTEPIAKVMFDELETLKAFIEHNLPGMFGTDNRTNAQLAERLRQFAESQAMDFDNPHIAMTLEEIADRLTGTITEAIERVRAIHKRETVNADYGGTRSICIACERPYPCQTIAALDGAPEPEWEYEVRNEVLDFKSDYTPDLEQAKRWAQEDVDDFIVRRRKAGPWLPVEEEERK